MTKSSYPEAIRNLLSDGTPRSAQQVYDQLPSSMLISISTIRRFLGAELAEGKLAFSKRGNTVVYSIPTPEDEVARMLADDFAKTEHANAVQSQTRNEFEDHVLAEELKEIP